MDLSIVIVNYRGWNYLNSCLEAFNSFQNSRGSASSDVHHKDRIVELRVRTTLRIRDRMKEH